MHLRCKKHRAITPESHLIISCFLLTLFHLYNHYYGSLLCMRLLWRCFVSPTTILNSIFGATLMRALWILHPVLASSGKISALEESSLDTSFHLTKALEKSYLETLVLEHQLPKGIPETIHNPWSSRSSLRLHKATQKLDGELYQTWFIL